MGEGWHCLEQEVDREARTLPSSWSWSWRSRSRHWREAHTHRRDTTTTTTTTTTLTTTVTSSADRKVRLLQRGASWRRRRRRCRSTTSYAASHASQLRSRDCRTNPPRRWLARSQAYGNGIFVGVGDSSTVVRSSDYGLTWSLVASPSIARYQYVALSMRIGRVAWRRSLTISRIRPTSERTTTSNSSMARSSCGPLDTRAPEARPRMPCARSMACRGARRRWPSATLVRRAIRSRCGGAEL